MRFALSADQTALGEAVRNLLDKECPPSAVRASWEGGPGYDRELFRALGEMGVFGLMVPGAKGGLGLGPIELVVVMEECGRAAVPGPLVEQAAAAVPLLADVPELADTWLAPAMAGEALVTFGPVGDAALGGDIGTPWGADADLALVDIDGRLTLLSPTDITNADPIASVDRSRRAAQLAARGGVVVPNGDALGRAAWERGVLGTAAFLVGLGARMVEMAVDYVKERRQFGVPVGSFQAVKHHLADAHLAVEYARPAVWRAAYSMNHSEDDMERDVSFASVYARRASYRASRAALQCHGAIGYSFEHDLHLWMKRAWVLGSCWGTEDVHRARVARAVIP